MSETKKSRATENKILFSRILQKKPKPMTNRKGDIKENENKEDLKLTRK